jgi:hypothetical protein
MNDSYHNIIPVRNGVFKSLHLDEARSGVKREKSLSEQESVYRPWGTGVVKCLHDVSYFVECRRCRRDKREANDNFQRFSAKCEDTSI